MCQDIDEYIAASVLNDKRRLMSSEPVRVLTVDVGAPVERGRRAQSGVRPTVF